MRNIHFEEKAYVLLKSKRDYLPYLDVLELTALIFMAILDTCR